MGAFRHLAGLLFVALFSGAAFAAQVDPLEGQVLINHGKGYRQVTASTQAAPGAKVVVNPGGSAQVLYPDGCAVVVRPGSVYTVARASPCLAEGGQATSGADGSTLALGAVVVGGGVAALLLLNNNDKAASP
jgi:hypothetical protein